MAKKIALLIGVSEYGEGIPPLSSALNDVEAMQRVLQNPNLGSFEQVERLLNPDAIAMRKAIHKLFREVAKDDLVLFFFSGHGITNDQNHLYLATRNTAKDDFEATAVDANFIQGQSNNCYAKRQVLILDACYSGAYAQGWRTKSVGVDIKKQLGAEGRVVLTSSSATQTSFEQEGATLSLYTQYLIEGIETGAADTDNDGNIHVCELHDYAKAKVQAVKPKMTPEIILDKEGYNILLAYAPKNPEVEYRKLVEQYAQNGELNEFVYLVLKPKRKTFGLTDEQADQIENEVLEPFRRRLANLESYKQEFARAVEQKYPLDEHILKILKDYQQDVLGLRDEDVEDIEKEITSTKGTQKQEAERLQRQREAEEAEKLQQKQEAERLQHQQEEAERIQKQQETERLERQRKQEEAERLKRQQEQETDDLSSTKGVNYTHLRDLLKAGKWKEADEETRSVMLKAAGREKEDCFDTNSIEKFPCTDLRTIDQLWVKYSNERFGFSVQKKIWLEVGKNWNAFCSRVEWQRSAMGWVKMESIKYYYEYDDQAPYGSLPIGIPHPIRVSGTKSSYRSIPYLCLFSRVQTCKL
ncbi:GUN4 domain-containing protein [Fortiea sp. LEGE XX443]|uniref:caspase, EACC1-associated type n=1 Tax=Fortiea sp. LEGE XX443 TaxID=1828611 RepID=UPI00187E2694|nr:GUN4 domain-containing protein [Fortiea sp. LEGE XX443]MBE9008532.1 GUN4 domain-containing protein [Fortiea sp. LEGE XX443]